MIIEVKDLVKYYGKFHALKSISFGVEKGSVFGFIGRNGAGKTTTMNILAGLISYESGKIRLMGKEFYRNGHPFKIHIGYLPETPSFYEYMNAYEYLDLIGDISGFNASDKKNRTDEILETVRLKKGAIRRIGGYSRGMKQRLALAVALFDKPKILFLDEPASALDPEGRLEMLKLIETLKEKEITIVLSTHILSDAERVCDTICVIDEGKILLSESLSGLYKKHIHPVLDIEFEDTPSQAQKVLKKIGWVRGLKISGKKLSLEVSDLGKAKKKIFGVLSDLKEVAISYRLRKRTLEDIFMSIINKKDE